MEARSLITEYLDVLDLSPGEPSLDLLSQIVRAHVATFAFSSIGPRLGDELPLDVDALFDRIVVRRRGGYCFEQNGLLFEVLRDLGFDVEMYLARVIHDQDTHPGLTHRVSIVALDGVDYVVDVGFGPQGPPIPVALGSDASIDRAWGDRAYRVSERSPGQFHVQVRTEHDWYSLYRFERVRYGPSDCEVGHFYSHRHPEATFVNNLVGSLILDGEVRSLRNREYWVRWPHGDERLVVEDAEGLHAILGDELGLRVTEREAVRLFDELPLGETA